MVQTGPDNNTPANPATNGRDAMPYEKGLENAQKSGSKFFGGGDTDHNGQTAADRDSRADMKGFSSNVRSAMDQAAQELGISPENTQKLMSMLGLGNAVMLVEMLGGVLNKLQENGAHGVGGEMGPPMADMSSAQAIGAQAAQQAPKIQSDLQVAPGN